MFTSAPVSMSALMGNVLSSTSMSIHTFKLSWYSLYLDLLVWLLDLPLPVTLGKMLWMDWIWVEIVGWEYVVLPLLHL